MDNFGITKLRSCTWKNECQNRDYVQEELSVQYQVKEETQLMGLKQKLSQNVAQISFISGKYVTIMAQPIKETIRGCLKSF